MHQATYTPSWKRDWLIAGTVLGLATLVFWVTDLDLKLQGWFYHPAQGGFVTEETPFWHWVYHYGIFVGYALAVAALVLISLSYWSAKYQPLRRQALMLVLVVFIGPGLLVNVVFKDHYGRPRPREVTEFGGTERFLKVWQPGSDGKSFPCGHCSMGFFLAVPYLFWRHRRRVLAYSALVVGIAYGVLLGWERVKVGAHFPSDVLWSGGMVWLTALALYYLLRVYEPVSIPELSDAARKKKARRVTLIVSIALPVFTVGLLLATPYISHKEFAVTPAELAQNHTQKILADVGPANVTLGTSAAGFVANYAVNAFGFPNSKLGPEWQPGATATYTITQHGWFTEVKNNLTLKVPVGDSLAFYLKVAKGKITLAPELLTRHANITLEIEQGDVIVPVSANADFHLTYTGPEPENMPGIQLRRGQHSLYTRPDAPLQLTVKLGKGKLLLRQLGQ